MTATERTTCRACGSTDLASVLDLGNQPLANRFLSEEQLEWQEPDFPLHMVRCTTCGLCQLTHVVDPEVLYRNYAYQSGHAEGWRDHCSRLAMDLTACNPDGAVLDIAANDGTLLAACAGNGHSVVGVEPARNLAAGDFPHYCDFWSPALAKTVVEGHGQFQFIVAQNVFGHVDDARGFLQGIAQALARDGVAIIECPWVVPLIERYRWDTIYHEHLSYWDLKPLGYVARAAGLEVVGMKYLPDLHGGTIRWKLGHAGQDPKAHDPDLYPGHLADAAFDRFAARVQDDIRFWNEYLQNPLGRGLAGYGASAKMNTFLNALPDRPHLVGIFDDSPSKQGLYTPGWHYPVLTPNEGIMAACDEMIIGAPNWEKNIMDRATGLGFQGAVRSIWRPSH